MLSAVALVGLTACGSPSGGSGTSAGSPGTPHRGGSVTVLVGAEPTSWDPAALVNNYGFTALQGNAVFGTLLTSEPGPGGTVEDGFAQTLKTTDDGTTWVLTLRPGLTFTDSTPFDAAAVAENWKRLTDPKLGTNSLVAASIVKSTEAAGQQLTITLTTPDMAFPHNILNSSMNWIASPASLASPDHVTKPVGAGPFKLQSWARQSKIVLARNDAYYDKALPYLDQITVQLVTDPDSRYSTLVSGGGQIMPTFIADKVADAKAAGLGALHQEANGGNAWVLNTRIAPFNDPRAREAFVKAIDPNGFNSAAYRGKSQPPASLFSAESAFAEAAKVPLPAFDRARAQSLFDELAADGKPFEVTLTATPGSKLEAETVQSLLAGYKNATVKVDIVAASALLTKLADKTFQTTVADVSFDDPEPRLFAELHTGSSSNRTGVSDPEIDKALEDARRTSDPAARAADYATVAKRVSALNLFWFYARISDRVTLRPQTHGQPLYGQGSLPVDKLWTGS